MERTIYLVFFLIIGNNIAHAQTDYKTKIYNCYIDNEMVTWKNTIDKLADKEYKTNFETLELLNFQYGYIAWCLGNEKEAEAEEYLKLALKNAEKLEERNYRLPLITAYKSALWGFEIGISFYLAPFLGPESMEFADKSVELDEQNYFGYIQKGNIEYYMPPVFGGSKSLALEYYLKAKKIMENKPGLAKSNWNYLGLLVNIARCYAEIEDYNKAKEWYERILIIEPNFNWVKKELLPELIIKAKENE